MATDGNLAIGEPVRPFVCWAAGQLGLRVIDDADGLTIRLPEELQARFDDRAELILFTGRHASNGEGNKNGEDRLLERFVGWLVEALGQARSAAAARPLGQPLSVHALSARLFSAYAVDGGKMHLAGCQLEDRPFLRMTYAATDDLHDGVRHVFVAADGSSVPPQTISDLGLDALERIAEAPPRISAEDLAILLAAGRRMAAQQFSPRDPGADAGQPLAVVLAWVKYATGSIQFTIGGQSEVIPFAGWAQTLTAPPYQCPHTGEPTFHLAATDDGRIVAADQINVCARSGRRVLASELVECSATGERVLEDFTKICPVSGKPAQQEQFVTCEQCWQEVSRPVVEQGHCEACRTLRRVGRDDARVASILEAHPKLAAWKRFSLAETRDAFILQAASTWRRVLVVLDRESVVPRHVATRTRLGRSWQPVEARRWGEHVTAASSRRAS